MRLQKEGVRLQVGEGAGVLVGKGLPGHARSPEGVKGGGLFQETGTYVHQTTRDDLGSFLLKFVTENKDYLKYENCRIIASDMKCID